jgi:hypothetical protein
VASRYLTQNFCKATRTKISAVNQLAARRYQSRSEKFLSRMNQM